MRVDYSRIVVSGKRKYQKDKRTWSRKCIIRNDRNVTKGKQAIEIGTAEHTRARNRLKMIVSAEQGAKRKDTVQSISRPRLRQWKWKRRQQHQQRSP